MKKIIVAKDELPDDIVKKILEGKDDDVVLVVPKNSLLKESADNFRAIREEAAAAGHHVYLESVDDSILELAREGGIEGVHPLLGANRKPLSDIVMVPVNRARKGSEPSQEALRGKKSVAVNNKEAVRRIEVTEEPSDEEMEMQEERSSQPREKSAVLSPFIEKVSQEDRKPFFKSVPREAPKEVSDALPPRRLWWIRLAGVVCALLFIVLAATWAVGRFYGWAEVSITFAKVPWERQVVISADKSAGKVDVEQNIVPAEVYNAEPKNTTQFFPATDKKSVTEKARGKITIVNAFGPATQSLVATTRFETSNGKIFRLTKQVTVPAAKMNGKKIATPGSVEAEVVADKPGADYNMNGKDKLTIPGFKGSPKFTGFYGTNLETSGGANAATPVAGDKDIEAAKDKVQELLRMSLESGMESDLRTKETNFVIVPGAVNFQVSKLVVNPAVDEKGNFSVIGVGGYRAVVFKESDIRLVMNAVAAGDLLKNQIQNLKLQDLVITYASTTVNFDSGRLSSTVSAKGTASADFSLDDFRAQMAGKPLREARGLVGSVNGISEAKIKVWPVWLQSLPSNIGKIKIVIK